MRRNRYPWLAYIQKEQAIHTLSLEELQALTKEARSFLVEQIPLTGGHLSSNLGVVELTIALHAVYQFPLDRLLWDTGHQAYTHKLLTGRMDRFCTLRSPGGLAPFPRRKESPYDVLSVGHASTALSAAVGIAFAIDRLQKPDLLIIINQNGFSIDRNPEGIDRLLKACFQDRTGKGGVGFHTNCTLRPVLPGHDLPLLIGRLREERESFGIRILPVVTRKGEGYLPAVEDPTSFAAIFGDWLCEQAAKDPLLCAITPAMASGSGIAEAHALTLAAGLAIEGMRPVVAIYASFLQRALDQWIHDLALDQFSVLLAVDRSGLVPFDGETHQGMFDLSFLRATPGVTIMAPSDGEELRAMLHHGHNEEGLSVVRYPKASASVLRQKPPTLPPIQRGKAALWIEREAIAFLNFGTLLPEVYAAAEGLQATLVDMRFVKPWDRAMVDHIANTHRYLVTVEEVSTVGGVGESIAAWIIQQGYRSSVLCIGLPDAFLPPGSREELLQRCALRSDQLVERVGRWKQALQSQRKNA